MSTREEQADALSDALFEVENYLYHMQEALRDPLEAMKYHQANTARDLVDQIIHDNGMGVIADGVNVPDSFRPKLTRIGELYLKLVRDIAEHELSK